MYIGTQFRYVTNYTLSPKELFAFYYLDLFLTFIPLVYVLIWSNLLNLGKYGEGRQSNSEFEKQLSRFKHTLDLCLSTVLSKSRASYFFFPSSYKLSHNELQAEFNFCEMLELSVGVRGCSEDRQLRLKSFVKH